MPVPIICLDDEMRQFAERFRGQFSKPQYQHFVIVLLGLLMCEGRRTLWGRLREVSEHGSLAGLSRFLSEAPWSQEELAASWLTHFRNEMRGSWSKPSGTVNRASSPSGEVVPSSPW